MRRRARPRATLLALGGSALLAAGCAERPPRADDSSIPPGGATSTEVPAAATPAAATPEPPTDPRFVEVSAEVGIDFVANTGAFGEKWLPETMGSGCAWVDFDVDGDPDLLLLSGRDFDGHPTGRRRTSALYRNDGGRFVDVTAAAGLDLATYAIGVTGGDWDGDGDPDLYVTALGPNRLWRNDGGRFEDVAPRLGVDDPGFGSSASWLDFDRDGDLDLFSLNYVEWTPETDVFCSLNGTDKSYCTPEVYPGAELRLWRNDGDAFVDVSAAAGIAGSPAKALGVLCLDLDDDGWVDVFVANDTQPNLLFLNRGDGTFSEEGMIAGVAFDEAGRARGAMGVDAADYDGSGLPSLTIGNFSNEMQALYHNEGVGFFIDSAPTSDLGRQSLLSLTFGTLFLDYDLDGRPDIFSANGHVETDIARVQNRVTYAQPPHLFRNLGDGTFTDVAPRGEALREAIVGRGAATADWDGDGDLDLVVTTSGGAARLYRNDGADGRRSIRVRLEGGAGSNRDGFGAKVRATVGGETRTAWAIAAHSYASQSENVVTFGLGGHPAAAEIVVEWPSGKTSRVARVDAGSRITVRESDASGE